MDISVLFETQEMAEEALGALSAGKGLSGISAVYSEKRPAALSEAAGIRWIQVLPYIMRSAEDPARPVHPVISPEAEGVLARNYEELEWLYETGYRGDIVADTMLYTMNAAARQVLRESGVTLDTVPFELNCHEIRERGTEGTELVAYGRIPLMLSAQCIHLTRTGSCSRSREAGAGKKNRIGGTEYLKDRKGVIFPVRRDCRFCCNVVYNSVPLSLHRELETIARMGIPSLRLQFTVEKTGEIVDIINYYVNLTDRENPDREDSDAVIPQYTRGHFRKGVK